MQRKKVARRRFGSSLIDLDSIILTEPQQRKSDLDDDTRSEWNDYVHSWLQPNRLSTASRSNPSSGVGTPSLVNDSTHSLRAECGLSGVSAFSTASPDPTEPFILTPPPATESPGRIMPSPLVIPSVPNSPTLRVLSSQDDPRQLLGLGLGSPVGPRSPKPPLRRPLGPRPNVISPTRKAVPVLTPEDEDEMRKEEARRSLVLI
jgi:hypothetical protein